MRGWMHTPLFTIHYSLFTINMNGIFKVKTCGDVRYAHDNTTQGVIGKRVVTLSDWLGDRTGTFTATAWGSTAYADLNAGDIICADLIMRTHEGVTIVTLAGFVKLTTD